MQAANVKQVSTPTLADKAINLTLVQQPKKLDVEVTTIFKSTVVELTKSQSFKRAIEANGDCV